jgi:serine/threonine-protein kinase
MAELREGSEFAGCRIDGEVGRGGMGVIYRGTELRLGRPVALKLIAGERAADPDFRARFEREARLTASIDHPNVIPVYAAGEEDGLLYLVMRYVDGTDLRHLLREHGPLPPRRVDALIAQVAAALDAAHAAGLVHRDVKPANVLIAAGARGEHAYLTDFGVVRLVDGETRVTDSGEFVGTVDFMAPEHLRGEQTDARSDVYALGCVLHTALTGTPPFRRETVPATITAHLQDPPPCPSETAGVPAAMDAVVARALAKDPADRFASAGDLARAVHAAIVDAPAPAGKGSVARGEAAGDGEPATEIAAPAPGRGGLFDDAPAGATAFTRVAAPREDAAPPRPAARDETRVRLSAPPPTPRRRGRVRRPLSLIALLLLLVVAGGGVLLAMDRGEETVRSDPGPLSEGEVRAAAERFAEAYAQEDPAALSRALTTDVKRVTPGDEQIGRSAVLAEYRRQFAGTDVRGYRFEDLEAEGGRAGRAAGRYVVTRAGGDPIQGDIVLGVRRDRGRARIGLIAAEPRS